MSESKSKLEVAILGGGRFANAVAALLVPQGARVRLWARTEAARAERQAAQDGLQVSADVGEVVAPADLVFFAVSAGGLESVANLFGDHARADQIVVHPVRGVGRGFALPHELIRSKSCAKKIGALGGPLHARELTSGRPLAAVIASRFPEVIATLRGISARTPVRIHPSRDVIGVEVAGAISNVSALAAGMSDALGLGDTARGILMTHGLVEAQRIGCALGADPATFTGLAGVGDLIPRHVTSTERHQTVGQRLVEGATLDAALAGLEGEVEGVTTALEARERARTLRLTLPLVEAVAAILSGEHAAGPALEAVLMLDDIELGHGLARA